MNDPAVAAEAPSAAEAAHFLRRFADLMSNGQNASYLHHAAGLLESLTARLIAAVDEEQLGRYKYETVTRHADALEAECEDLKHDIDGHVNIASSILSERDALKSKLEGKETELAELNAALISERTQLAVKSEAHEKILAGFRAAFDRERDALIATAKLRSEELEELRRSSEGEREKFQSELKARHDELETLGAASRRESGELQARIAQLEAKRGELRSALGRITDLRSQAIKPYEVAEIAGVAKPGPEAGANSEIAQPDDRNLLIGEANAVVSKAALRQARAQFEYLARECVLRGDIASQVMCELGAYTLDIALSSRGTTDQLPVSAVALNILASPGSTPPRIAKTM
jgi:cell division septum initiation protein DivIVA